jgi:hypothetical protein
MTESFFLIQFLGWLKLNPLVLRPYTVHCTSPRWLMRVMEHLVEWELTGETEVLKRNLPESSTNPTWLYLRLNLGCHGKKSATNCWSYGTAILEYTGVSLREDWTVWLEKHAAYTADYDSLVCYFLLWLGTWLQSEYELNSTWVKAIVLKPSQNM